MGILDYETGKVYCEEHKKYDAQIFNDFLENVLKQYLTRKIVMVLYNAKIHHTKLIHPFFNKVKERMDKNGNNIKDGPYSI